MNKKNELPPFLMSSVPKSGTHLLNQILNGIPNIKSNINDAEKKFFWDYYPDGDTLIKDHFYRLGKLQPNEFGIGHIFYSDQYSYLLKRLNMKHIFIYRDPRDILVSLAYYIPKGWEAHPFHSIFNNQKKTTKERCLLLLDGLQGFWPNFEKWIRPFFNWIHHAETLSLSFEDLAHSRKKTLIKIIDYLWSNVEQLYSKSKLVRLMEENIQPNQSYTYRKGNTGSWKEEFDDELITKFKEKSGQLLIDFGYETTNSW